jgi:NAD+ synthase
MKQEIINIEQWLKEYCQNANKKGYIIGLSGGIDSAVDAEKLANNLNINFKIINLIKTFEIIKQELGKINNITQANIKSRLRMVILHALANQNSYLVAGTGNLSELMIGYFTKYGDGGVDIEPIGNYYKTEIYEMAKFLPEIPQNIISKPPSADLWEGQTDEEEIGITYKKLDYILKVINGHCIENDYDNSIFNINFRDKEKIKLLIHNSLHKNNLPPRYIRTKKT